VDSLFTHSLTHLLTHSQEVDMKSPLTSKSWLVLWNYLRKSPTLDALRQRLDKLKVIYPSKSAVSYIEFFWSTSAHWALCCYNWDLTLGYQATSLQEGVHSSMKIRLKKQKVALHEVVTFFREVMMKRKFTSDCNSDRMPLKKLYAEAEGRGFEPLSEILRVFLTEEAQQITLGLLNSGLNYNVEKIENDTALIECYEHTKFRNTSSERFKIIIDNHILNKYIGSFYKVTTRGTCLLVDIVAVFSNGSFASTDPYFANHGIPSPQIMSVFIAGYIAINVFFHFHPLYLHHDFKGMSSNDAKQLSVTINQDKLVVITEVNVEACWNFGTLITESEWKIVGLGGLKYATITHPNVNSIRNHPDSIAEICKKEVQRIMPIITYDERYRIIFFKCTAYIGSLQADEALSNAKARQEALGYANNFISVDSVTAPPLVVANNLKI
jgi:hypothetical protein